MSGKKSADSEKKISKKISSKDINFFVTRKVRTYNKKTANRNAIVFFISFLCIFAVSFPAFSTLRKNLELRSGIEQLKKAIAIENSSEDYKALQQKTGMLNSMRLYSEAAELAGTKFSALPKSDPDILNTLQQRLAKGVSILALSYSDGIYTVNCLTQNINSPPETVESLLATGKFRSVKYKGFQASSKYAGYEFSVECAVKGEGK